MHYDSHVHKPEVETSAQGVSDDEPEPINTASHVASKANFHLFHSASIIALPHQKRGRRQEHDRER